MENPLQKIFPYDKFVYINNTSTNPGILVRGTKKKRFSSSRIKLGFNNGVRIKKPLFFSPTINATYQILSSSLKTFYQLTFTTLCAWIKLSALFHNQLLQD